MLLRRLLDYWRNFLYGIINLWYDCEDENGEELPGDFVRVSTCLSEVMTDIGVTQEIVELRRKVGIERAALSSLQWMCQNRSEIVFNFGSQSEGSTTVGLFSDLDGIYMRLDVQVIKEESEWQKGKVQVMLQPSDFYGYRRLLILSFAGPSTETTLAEATKIYGEKNVEKKDGKIYLKHRFLLGEVGHFTTHGPAYSKKEDFGNRTEDFVNAFICRYTPEEILFWLKRVDRSQWPSADVKEYVKNHACFLVAVGHKQSKHPYLEYRVSCSFAERKLMFSMNITQIRCLIIMKMVVKTRINKIWNGSLKSYFCKTALFFTIEETQNQGWEEKNIVPCVIKCMQWLENCFSRNCMPHYFMSSLNMLEGRYDNNKRKAVVNALRTLKHGWLNALLEVQFDQVGHRLAKKLCLKSKHDNEVLIETLQIVEENTSRFLLDAYHKYCRLSVPALLVSCGGFIGQPELSASKLKTYLKTCDFLRDDELYQLSIKRIAPHLYSSLGTLFASIAWQQGEELSTKAKFFLSLGKYADAMSGKIKFASTLYKFKEYAEAELIIDEVLKTYYPDDIAAVCGCSRVKMFEFPEEYCKKWKEMIANETVENSTAFCVLYLSNDVDAMPSEFRALLFPKKGLAIKTVSIDPLPHLYGLQFLIYRQQGRHYKAIQSLFKLDICVKNGKLYHPDSAIAIRDICFQVQGAKPEDKSIVIYSRLKRICK